MKKLIIGVSVGVAVFTTFLYCEMVRAQDSSRQADSKKIEVQGQTEDGNQKNYDLELASLREQVEMSQKYVEAGQKNLDLWLKYLAFTLSVLIGYSIFNGLRTREQAKEELKEIKEIKTDIKRAGTDAEQRLKVVSDQLLEIERTANNAKQIEQKMSEQLRELGEKEDQTLDAAQRKKLELLLGEAKTELQNSGLEALKNLYLAKYIKARDDKKWEECIRLLNVYLDFEEKNASAFGWRGYSRQQLPSEYQTEALKKNIYDDYSMAISLDPNEPIYRNNRGNVQLSRKEYELAIQDYTEAIKLNPDYHLAYQNRAIAYDKSNNHEEAAKDRKTVEELKSKQAT